jgi:hypothetical protein
MSDEAAHFARLLMEFPKTHIESFYELEENDFVELMLVVRSLRDRGV